MKKKIVLFLFTTILAVNVACAQSDWGIYKIDNKLSVKLPEEPRRKDENNLSAMGKDSSTYFVTIIDLGTDTDKVSQMLKNPDFANGLKNAIVGNMPGFTLSDMKRSNWKGYPRFQAEGDNVPTQFKLYFSMLIIGARIYCLGNILPEGKSNKNKIDFFDLLVLN